MTESETPSRPAAVSARHKAALASADADRAAGRLSRSAHDVLRALWSFAGGARTIDGYNLSEPLGGFIDVFPSVDGGLTGRTGLGRSTIFAAIRDLEARGFVRKIRRGGGRSLGRSRYEAGRPNIYRLLASDCRPEIGLQSECRPEIGATAVQKSDANLDDESRTSPPPASAASAMMDLPLFGGVNPPLRSVANSSGTGEMIKCEAERCGALFLPYRRTMRFCSERCRIRGLVERKAAASRAQKAALRAQKPSDAPVRAQHSQGNRIRCERVRRDRPGAPAQCPNVFVPTRWNSRYCSQACREAAEQQRKTIRISSPR